MSLTGPPPAIPLASGPFELSIANISSSPYSFAMAMFLMNVGSRFIPMEFTKGQEKFLNQPWFRRILIFMIFFMATRNIIIALWLSIIAVICIGYLFNENSSMYILGKNNGAGAGAGAAGGSDKPTGLTPEENAILKSLQDKASRLETNSEKPAEVNTTFGMKSHKKYQDVLRVLWA